MHSGVARCWDTCLPDWGVGARSTLRMSLVSINSYQLREFGTMKISRSALGDRLGTCGCARFGATWAGLGSTRAAFIRARGIAELTELRGPSTG